MAEYFYVYFLASKRNGTIYVGVTNNMGRRVWEHREGAVDSFTKKYRVTMLVYFEVFQNPEAAIQREKTIKSWPRQ